MIVRSMAISVLTIIYGLAKAISVIGKRIFKRRSTRGRLIINGTFHNPNWFFAHIAPIAQSNYGEVILICDDPVPELPNLVCMCPPRWAGRIFSKAGARALWTLIAGIRHPADTFIGYHIFPSAVIALMCGRLTGAKTVYQVTAGPLELEGGGWHTENKMLVALGRPSTIVEKLAHAVMREFDLVVVRGSRARAYVLEQGYVHALETVTGSVEMSASNPAASNDKDLDMVLVGRLTEYKRPDRFIQVVASVVRDFGACRAALVGDGPDRSELEVLARSLGVSEYITFMGQRHDVPDILARSKIFVLTSRWEGVSIAMLEAMAVQAVPVVSDVGDLSDFVESGVTGYLVKETDTDTFAKHIVELLSDEEKRQRLANAGRDLVVQHCDRHVLARRWFELLTRLKSTGNADVITYRPQENRRAP